MFIKFFLLFIILLIFNKNILNIEKFTDNLKPKKLAFCFLIYDKINHEEIWKKFFDNINKDKYNIYIHYKEDKKLKYFDNYKIKDTVETKWCEKSLVIAQNNLLKEAIKDKNNEHFIFISNSCIPLKSFNYIYNKLNPKYSYFNKSRPFPKIVKLEKASQWCILNRKHTELILNNKEIINTIITSKNIKINGCPDEYSYITLLYHLNLENELILTQNLSTDATTFTGWKNMVNYKEFKNSKKKGQPNNYNFISKEELDFLLKSKSLFGRKFIDGCKGLENLENMLI